MVLPTQIVNREPVAQGMLLDGRRFTVSNVTYSSPIRGMGEQSVVVDIDSSGTLPQEGVGFASVEDAFNYLQATDVREYRTWDEYGNETTIKRQGMGIPDGMIRKLQEQNPEPETTVVTSSTTTTEEDTDDAGPAENF